SSASLSVAPPTSSFSDPAPDPPITIIICTIPKSFGCSYCTVAAFACYIDARRSSIATIVPKFAASAATSTISTTAA
ncbi:hypothetical protein HK102_001058, partial [Quaeritorhiza haematococci]